MSKQGENWNK